MLKNDFVVFYSDIKKYVLKMELNSYFLDSYGIFDIEFLLNLKIIEANLEQGTFFVGLNSIIFLLNCDKKFSASKILLKNELKPNRADLNQFSGFKNQIFNNSLSIFPFNFISKNIIFPAVCVLFSNLGMFRYIRYITILVLVSLVSCLGYLFIVSDFCR